MTEPQPQPHPELLPERLPPEQLSALWHTCDSGNTAPLAKLIEALKPRAMDLTPGLWVAIKSGHTSMIRYLLERGISINGYTVRVALDAGSIPALEILREFGWDVNMRLAKMEGTALNYVTHDPTLVSYLLAHGANPNLGPAIGFGLGDARRTILVPTSGAILQAAARHGSIESLDMLIAHGAVLANAAAMHAAVEGGNIAMMARVLELGADVDEMDRISTIGWPCFGTPLLRAIRMGSTETVRFLLERGANLTKRGHGGETALEVVKREEVSAEMMELIKTAVEKEMERNGEGLDKYEGGVENYGAGWEIRERME